MEKSSDIKYFHIKIIPMTTQRATIKDLREEYKRLRAQGLLRPPRYTKQEQIAMATGGYPYETYGPIEKGARNAPMLSPEFTI